MACKMNSGIYAVNTTQGITIQNGGVYAPTNVVNKRGCAVEITSNGFTIDSLGCQDVSFDVEASISVEGLTAATPVSATIYQDGVAIPSITATTTVVAANDVVNLNLCGTVTVRRCNKSTFTIVISGQNVETNNLSLKVRRV